MRPSSIEELKRKGKPKRRPKYNAKPTVVDGIRFDSKLESRYYNRLKLAQKLGALLYFLRQVPIHLPGGVTMRIDFLEFWCDGVVTYTDTKGFVTRDWEVKRKIAENLYPIKIQLVRSA